MASYDPYDTSDNAQPRPVQPAPAPAQPSVQTSQTPTQVWEQPSTPAPYTPPPNAGSWNSYYQQPGTTQNLQAPYQSPYQMGADFRYGQGGQANTQLGQYGNRLEGFDSGKLNDPTRDSAKYMFGRLASRYEPTQQGFQQLMQDPEFQRLGMQSLGNGKIRLPNGDTIDVVRGFQSGGQGWQWGAETVNGQPAQAQAPQGDPWGQVQQSYMQQQQQQYAQQQAQYQQQMQAWQQYQQQLAAWQQSQQQSQPQAMPQQQQQAPPTAYYQAPQQLPASPNYGGMGGYNTGVGLQGGGGAAPAGSPYGQTFNYLAQGMPSPYYYG